MTMASDRFIDHATILKIDSDSGLQSKAFEKNIFRHSHYLIVLVHLL